MIISVFLSHLSYAVAIAANMVIAAFVYVNNPKAPTNRLFALLCFNISAWLTALYVTSLPFYLADYLLLARMTLLLATPLNVLFFLFAKAIPDYTHALTGKRLAALLGAAGGVMVLSATPLVFSEVIYTGAFPDVVTGPGMAVFGAFVTAMDIGAVGVLYLKGRKATGRRREQLDAVLFGALTMFGAMFGTILLPVALFGSAAFVPLAPLYTLFFTALAARTVFLKGLIDVKVVRAEMLIALLMIVSSVQMFFAVSPEDFFLRLATFLTVCVVTVPFLGSVHEEIRRSRELQGVTLQLKAANDHLKEMDRIKSEFVSIASHQLRTPISVIKGYFSLMLEGAYGKLDPTLREKVESMNQMNERLVQMVNNMLNVSRIERNKIEYTCAEIDIVPMIRQVIDELGQKAAAKGLALLTDVKEGDRLVAYVDPQKFQEVISNLIDNAIKYSHRGAITVSAIRHGRRKEYQVTVDDQGIGMNVDAAAHVFQKFFRASDPAVTRETGTGLGLHICGIFVRGMGGDIWVEKTAPGKGTAIAFTVPAEPGVQCLPHRKPAAEPL